MISPFCKAKIRKLFSQHPRQKKQMLYIIYSTEIYCVLAQSSVKKKTKKKNLENKMPTFYAFQGVQSLEISSTHLVVVFITLAGKISFS